MHLGGNRRWVLLKKYQNFGECSFSFLKNIRVQIEREIHKITSLNNKLHKQFICLALDAFRGSLDVVVWLYP